MTATTLTRVSAWQTTAPSAAEYRQWVRDFHSMLTGAGLVQTADTGQINPDTISLYWGSTDYGTLQGASLWRFNDAQQANFPIFIKFRFFTMGMSNTKGWQWHVQVGTGTDGAGELTGTRSSWFNVGDIGSATQSWDSYDPLARPWYSSGGEGYFTLATHNRLGGSNYAGSGQGMLVIERSSSLEGVYDDEAIHVVLSGPMGNYNTLIGNSTVLVKSRPSTQTPVYAGGRAVPQPWLASGGAGADVYLAPCVGDLPWPKGQLRSILGYYNADLGALTPVSVPLGGQDAVFMPLGSNFGTHAGIGGAGVSALCPAIRYE